LEDGFLRSLDLGRRGAAPLSLVEDRSGIYYDATRPSDLETLLESAGWESPELSAKAEKALAAIVAGDLSKYNHAPPAPSGLLGDNPKGRILVLDQTFGDKSVELGLASAENFAAMLAAARAGHPGADIFIKTHPDVIAGKRRGYFNPAGEAGVKIIGRDYSPLSLLAQADEVYTVTSQMGLEALFLGKPVHCFGLPFYAGWGLTHDQLNTPRRTRRRTLLELFAAAYLLYARYVNPVTGRPADIFEVIRLLSAQRRQNEANRGPWAVCGFTWWKHTYARVFLRSTDGGVKFFRRLPEARKWAEKNRGRVAAWSSRLPDAAETGGPVLRVEDGFLRSVGLGSDFNAPYSLVLDPDGVYYDPARPSRLEKLLAEYDFQADPDLLTRAAALRRGIVEKNLSKYNLGGQEWQFAAPEGRRVLLVPGQVEDDASILRGSPAIQTNLGLLQEVRRRRPQDFIIFKPHPEVEKGNRRGLVPAAEAERLADLVVRGLSLNALWPHIHEVHTLTSLTGFEALLRGLPTHTYGGPFYAGWGLTHDGLAFGRRGRRLTLDELVAGALILYPTYYAWGSGQFCGPEEILWILSHQPLRSRPRNRVLNLADRFLHYILRK
jgi:capsular polysaccharide export protein